MKSNRLCVLLQIQFPIVQAPMNWITGAVRNSDLLGGGCCCMMKETDAFGRIWRYLTGGG
jgi:hypothetical protein